MRYNLIQKVEASLIKKDKKVTDYWYADRKKCLIVSAAIMLVFAFCILGAFYGIVASPSKNKDPS